MASFNISLIYQHRGGKEFFLVLLLSINQLCVCVCYHYYVCIIMCVLLSLLLFLLNINQLCVCPGLGAGEYD